MSENTTEIWLEVPASAGQYLIGNHGHLRLVFKSVRAKRKRGKTDGIKKFVNEIKPLCYNFEAKKLGWMMSIGGEFGFTPREELMRLFADAGIPADIDTSKDEEAIARSRQAKGKHQTSPEVGNDRREQQERTTK